MDYNESAMTRISGDEARQLGADAARERKAFLLTEQLDQRFLQGAELSPQRERVRAGVDLFDHHFRQRREAPAHAAADLGHGAALDPGEDLWVVRGGRARDARRVDVVRADLLDVALADQPPE